MKAALHAIACCLFFAGTSFSQVTNKTPLDQLVAQESAWDKIMQMKKASRNQVDVLDKDFKRADSALFESQFPVSTYLGSMIYECGGILIDKGWIRILGSGCKKLDRSIPGWNKGKIGKRGSFLLVADDVLGGFFGLKMNSTSSPDSCGIYYFGPNSLKWKPIGLNYRTFLAYCFSGNIKRFYEDFRWQGWESEVQQLNGNQVISCYPLLWTREGLGTKSNRKVVSVQKQWENYPQQTKFLADESFQK